MDTNQKKFNLYVFLSTFSRNLIEVFIPIILYKFGYSLKEVLFYYLFVNLFLIILTYPGIIFSKKYSNRSLSIIGIFSFVVVQFLLTDIKYSIFYLLSLSFFYSLYRIGYWLARRFYTLKVMPKDNVSMSYSWISIVNQVALIVASYIGSILLDFMSIELLTGISIILFLISLYPLYTLKFKYEDSSKKLDFIGTIKKIPLSNLYLFGAYESITVIKFFFSLYLFIYVKDNYHTVGIMNLLTNIATIAFVYFYGKKINDKKNYINLSIIFIVLVYIFKANITSYLLILVAFLEGIATKMYELSMSKEFYLLSKKFDYSNYNLVYEIVLGVFRSFILLISFLFINDLKVMIYFSTILIFISIFIKFKDLRN